jgi:uncharacterized protein (TIGR00255 family)
MTGFGSAAQAEGPFSVRAEIRSVNHRFLQVKIRLPAELVHLETDVEALIKKKLERGSIAAHIAVQRQQGALAPKVDVEVARAYQKALGELSAGLGIARELSLETLVTLPGVLGPSEDGRLIEREAELVLAVVVRALESLGEMREHEGSSLRADLARSAESIENLVAKIEKRMPVVVREHHKNLQKRVGELLAGDGTRTRAVLAANDLAREIALLADRMDVSEELARLKSHLDQWEKLLAKGGGIGRQLDFLVQELLREANTIGSKCSDAKVAQTVVELKTWIERLREQVQNVE